MGIPAIKRGGTARPTPSELVRDHWDRAHRAAYLITRDADEAEDIAQEAMLKAARGLRGYDPSRPIQPWVNRIIANAARDWLRAKGRRPRTADGEVPEMGMEDDLADRIAEVALPDQIAAALAEGGGTKWRLPRFPRVWLPTAVGVLAAAALIFLLSSGGEDRGSFAAGAVGDPPADEFPLPGRGQADAEIIGVGTTPGGQPFELVLTRASSRESSAPCLYVSYPNPRLRAPGAECLEGKTRRLLVDDPDFIETSIARQTGAFGKDSRVLVTAATVPAAEDGRIVYDDAAVTRMIPFGVDLPLADGGRQQITYLVGFLADFSLEAVRSAAKPPRPPLSSTGRSPRGEEDPPTLPFVRGELPAVQIIPEYKIIVNDGVGNVLAREPLTARPFGTMVLLPTEEQRELCERRERSLTPEAIRDEERNEPARKQLRQLGYCIEGIYGEGGR